MATTDAHTKRAKFCQIRTALRTGPPQSEAGDTLIEVLIALVVLGLTTVALLAAFATSIAASDEHRGLSTIDTVLKSYVEEAIYTLQTQPNPGYSSSCSGATASNYTTAVNAAFNSNYTLPATGGTYTTDIQSVEFWSSSGGFSALNPCPTRTIGPQLLTAEAIFTPSPNSAEPKMDQTLQFVITDPTIVTPEVGCSPCNGTAIAGNSFNFPVTATGGPLPTLTASGLPTGASLVNNGSGSWSISGTVDTAATSTITITGKNDAASTSTTFTLTITPAAASKLVVTNTPVGGAEGTAFATQPVVTVEDQYNNVVTSDTGPVTLSVTGYTAGNGGTTRGSLGGCSANPATASAGVATFSSCKITGTAGAGTYTLTASRSGLTSATTSVTVSAGSASQLVFTPAPVGGTEGSVFSTQPKASVEDSFGNVVTSDTGQVALSITNYAAGNGGTTKGTLSCTANTVSAAAGIATFANCKITGTAGAGTYSLSATRSGLTSATANITEQAGAAASLSFTTIGTQVHNVAFSVQVSVVDANGNLVTSNNTASVTLSKNSGPSRSTLTCTPNPVTANAGVASFPSCKVSAAGSYKLSAAATGLTSGTSNTFTAS